MTSTTHPVAGPLGVIFTVNDTFISRAIDGLTDDQLWHRPTDQTNPMYWLLGHIVHTRGAVLRILGEECRTGWGERFQRGAVLKERAEYPALAEIERLRAELGARIAARLNSVTGAELTRDATGHQLPSAKTVGDQIAFLALHESYHVGQLAYVRKMLGYKGIVG